jgi:carbon-monoxide dehydrogenase small subunit
MTVDFILNGEDVVIRTEPNDRLVNILRANFGLLGTKAGCLSGKCGFCTVTFNGSVTPSCLIPAFRIRGSEIITIEGFRQTYEYQDIVAGFAKAGLKNCSFCETGKIMQAGALLEKSRRPTRQEILHAFGGIKCRCTNPDDLVAGIEKAAEIRQRRLYGRAV